MNCNVIYSQYTLASIVVNIPIKQSIAHFSIILQPLPNFICFHCLCTCKCVTISAVHIYIDNIQHNYHYMDRFYVAGTPQVIAVTLWNEIPVDLLLYGKRDGWKTILKMFKYLFSDIVNVCRPLYSC